MDNITSNSPYPSPGSLHPVPVTIDRELAKFRINPEVASENQKTARYVIATTSSFAIGVTLAEAVSVSILEPDFHPQTTIRVFHRYCR